MDKLRQASRSADSLVCVGLDVATEMIPRMLLKESDPVYAFNKAIVEATADLVCAYKLNLAFYERLGPRGMESMLRTVQFIPRHLLVIADAKRGDVSHSSKGYADAIFDFYGFDAVTASPYLGRDSLTPFLERHDKGVFVLCRTSNAGAADFQELVVAGGQRLYELVAQRVVEWDQYGNCGLVVGATDPEALVRVRRIAPDLPLLVPGIGAQGGDVAMAARYAVDSRGEMAIISSSRGILYASTGDDFAQAARGAVVSLRQTVNRHRQPGQ